MDEALALSDINEFVQVKEQPGKLRQPRGVLFKIRERLAFFRGRWRPRKREAISEIHGGGQITLGFFLQATGQLSRRLVDVRAVHEEYLAVGVDAIETNTFGANWANLAEYGIEDRIFELAFAGGLLARQSADKFSTTARPRFVIGSLGPGNKLPSLGHTTYEK